MKVIEIVGEAASKVSPLTQDQLSGIPWIPIRHMRHRLVHDYFRINLDIVWQTIQEDLKPLISALDAALTEPPP